VYTGLPKYKKVRKIIFFRDEKKEANPKNFNNRLDMRAT